MRVNKKDKACARYRETEDADQLNPMYRRLSKDVDVSVSPELEEWFATKGRELERSFLADLKMAIGHADKHKLPYARISIEGLLNYHRFHKPD